jgi:hypothetical protein
MICAMQQGAILNTYIRMYTYLLGRELGMSVSFENCRTSMRHREKLIAVLIALLDPDSHVLQVSRRMQIFEIYRVVFELINTNQWMH